MSILRCAARSSPFANISCGRDREKGLCTALKQKGVMLPYATYLIDLDGVIYRGNTLLPGAREFIAWLETNSKKYLFLTNNSFATGEQILAKLQRLGIAADSAHLLSAGQAAVQHISRRFPGGAASSIGQHPFLPPPTSHPPLFPSTTAAKPAPLLPRLI